ncbi:MAG: hypothetical protein IJU66_04400 [Oscillospiraceae bacterium]|nr:hypothetical protein [Oscillospiraceae bacterium]
MKKRVLSALLALLLTAPLFSVSARAALPDGYWKYLSAYMAAVESGDEDAILKTGDEYLAFLSGFARNREIAENQYNVYNRCMELSIYEKRGDWDSAIRNTQGLLDASTYLDGIGVDRKDMIRRCRIHLDALEPFAGVYALSRTRRDTYGSSIAAASGAYYGSTYDGRYGEGSICSFYVELERETAKQFDYLIEAKADGKRVILVNLNFENEAATVAAIPTGAYDGSLRETLGYLATVKSPVLLRIGGEMDLWSEGAAFIKAYRYAAAMARSLAPKVELVWSPNYVSGWGVDVGDFYPGDDVVDWVGVSLYYNYDANGSDDSAAWIEYIQARQFADPIAAARRVFSVAAEHGKPAIATEGGVNRANGEAYAAKQAAKEFSTLTMVYPQVKALVYFDRSDRRGDYRLGGAAAAAVDAAIESNSTLIAPGASSAGTYVPIAQYDEEPGGAAVFGATGRTYGTVDMSVTWRLDGTWYASTPSSPNLVSVDAGSLSVGKHKLDAVFDDGNGYRVTKTYTLRWDGKRLSCTEGFTEAPEPAAGGAGEAPVDPARLPAVERTPADKVGKPAGDYFFTDIVTTVNGTRIDAINVGGMTLINVEDLSTHGFTVVWNEKERTLRAAKSSDAPLGGSEAASPSGKVGAKLGVYYYTDIVTYLDGYAVNAYNTGGRTYICAEDMRAYGYSVIWDGEARTLTVVSR